MSPASAVAASDGSASANADGGGANGDGSRSSCACSGGNPRATARGGGDVGGAAVLGAVVGGARVGGDGVGGGSVGGGDAASFGFHATRAASPAATSSAVLAEEPFWTNAGARGFRYSSAVLAEAPAAPAVELALAHGRSAPITAPNRPPAASAAALRALRGEGAIACTCSNCSSKDRSSLSSPNIWILSSVCKPRRSSASSCARNRSLMPLRMRLRRSLAARAVLSSCPSVSISPRTATSSFQRV